MRSVEGRGEGGGTDRSREYSSGPPDISRGKRKRKSESGVHQTRSERFAIAPSHLIGDGFRRLAAATAAAGERARAVGPAGPALRIKGGPKTTTEHQSSNQGTAATMRAFMVSAPRPTRTHTHTHTHSLALSSALPPFPFLRDYIHLIFLLEFFTSPLSSASPKLFFAFTFQLIIVYFLFSANFLFQLFTLLLKNC